MHLPMFLFWSAFFILLKFLSTTLTFVQDSAEAMTAFMKLTVVISCFFLMCILATLPFFIIVQVQLSPFPLHHSPLQHVPLGGSGPLGMVGRAETALSLILPELRQGVRMWSVGGRASA